MTVTSAAAGDMAREFKPYQVIEKAKEQMASGIEIYSRRCV